MHTVSGSISLPSPGFFSPFPHGTGSLSVDNEYLALEDGPPMFRQDFTCPALLDSLCMAFVYGAFTLCGHPSQDVLLAHAQLNWANPGSLAATAGISVDFFSSGYLDVSVLPVRFRNLCIQLRMTLRSGCPIRRSPDITLVISSPRLFADFHVLLRLLSPRHPPCALIHLIIQPQVISTMSSQHARSACTLRLCLSGIPGYILSVGCSLSLLYVHLR